MEFFSVLLTPNLTALSMIHRLKTTQRERSLKGEKDASNSSISKTVINRKTVARLFLQQTCWKLESFGPFFTERKSKVKKCTISNYFCA